MKKRKTKKLLAFKRRKTSEFKSVREKKVKLRKNFFPTLVVSSILWIFLGLFVCFIDPELQGALQAFFVIAFVNFVITFSIIFANTRRGVLMSLGTTSFLILKYFGLGNIVNLILIFVLLISVELYLNGR